MRVALLPSAFAPHIGGVEVLTDGLARSLERTGHEVEVWTSRSPNDALPDIQLVDGLRVRRFVFDAPRAAPRAALEWPARAGSSLARMRKAVRAFQPDLLHVQCFGVNGVYATLLSYAQGIPLVVTLQGETFMDDHDLYAESLFLRTGLRLGLRRARRVTGCSLFTLEDATNKFGLDGGKAQVVFNGVDLDDAEASAPTVPFERFVFSLGRIVHRKGFDLLVEAWGRIAERHPEVGLVVAGHGPELPYLRSLVGERHLGDRVLLAGPMSRADVAGMMKRADIFVMPSRIEAFGIVVLEAWRAGTPAVVTANGGTSEFVEDGVTGLVVNPNDTASLGDAVSRLLADSDLRTCLASAALERLSSFGWSEISQQYEHVYEEVVSGTTPRRSRRVGF